MWMWDVYVCRLSTSNFRVFFLTFYRYLNRWKKRYEWCVLDTEIEKNKYRTNEKNKNEKEIELNSKPKTKFVLSL